MEPFVSALITKYEEGALSRRQLIGALVAVMASGTTAGAVGLTGVTLDHVSLQVSNPQRTRDFYARVFGLSEPAPNSARANGSIRLDLKGGGYFVIQAGNPAGSVDHVCIRLDRFNKEDVTRQLKELGITPIDEALGAGFHIVDPDGFRVQIT
jgi:catechol 2,3-dioxygenase-like lactoylglutathione lyase family enzyme